MERIPKPGEFYRHFKGGLYQVAAVAEHTETGEKLVVYQALYGGYRVYARPLAMFLDEVDRVKYPDAGQTYRFEKAEPDAGSGKGAAAADGDGSDGTAGLNPLIADFAEAEDFGEKLAVFAAMRRTVTQEDLDVLFEMLDLQPAAGDINARADSIEAYLKMQLKYNGTRLR